MASNEKGLRGLQGKTAIVTGASSGIGRATALAFAREGVKVVVSDVNVEGGQETVRLIKQQGGEAIFLKCDVSNAAEVKALVDRTVATFGRLDFACNNAGIVGERNPTADCALEEWNRVIAVNLTGVFLGMKYQIPEMLKQGGGAIVNVASIAGHLGFAGLPAYVSAKHGVVGLTKSTAIEYARQNIRVTVVCPAVIDTPMVGDNLSAEAIAQIVMAHPVGRMGKSEEVAEAIVFLCSDGASFMTASSILVDGGYVAQ